VYDDAPIATSSRKTTTADDSDDDEDEDLDLDIEIDINQLTSENKASLNKVATHYGMAFGDFARMLILDREEMQVIRENKLEREQDLPVKVRQFIIVGFIYDFNRVVELVVTVVWQKKGELKNGIFVHQSSFICFCLVKFTIFLIVI
jgi:hypothetical protein